MSSSSISSKCTIEPMSSQGTRTHATLTVQETPIFQDSKGKSASTFPIFTYIPPKHAKAPTPQKFGQYLAMANQNVFGLQSQKFTNITTSLLFQACDADVEDGASNSDDVEIKESRSHKLWFIVEKALGLSRIE